MTTNDVLDRGFPVTRRLGELPGFEEFVEGQRGRLSELERSHLCDWLVAVDAEELEANVAFTPLFHEYLARTRDELEGAWACAA